MFSAPLAPEELGPWTTYGGGVTGLIPVRGTGLVAVRLAVAAGDHKKLTLGAEIYYKTSNRTGIDESKGYTVGAIINLTDNHHLLLSGGQDVSGPNYHSFYIAYQFTFGPEKKPQQ